jgi:hypothetical protein
MPGDWISVSTTPIRRPSAASSVATLAVVFDLPVPPWNEWMAMILDMVGPYGLGSQSLSQEDAEALAVQTVREARRERRDDRKPDAPAPDLEDIEKWERMRDERRKEEGYRLR